MNQQRMREWTLSVQAQRPITSQASESFKLGDRHQQTSIKLVPYSSRTAFPLRSDLECPDSGNEACHQLASCIISFLASFPLIAFLHLFQCRSKPAILSLRDMIHFYR